jgi:nitrite reductase/ring-hydroxylating ferredoxin subunit
MIPFRRALLASAFAVLAGCVVNPAPVVDADANRTLPVPQQLGKPGDQVKVQLPGYPDPILVWRTEIGFGGTALRCNHCRTEVQYNAAKGWLDCLGSRCRYRLDGTVLEGPTKKALRVYLVDLDGERLRILG